MVSIPPLPEMRRAWAHQLMREHRSICFQFSIALAPPIFEISDAASRWGAWNARQRLISISSRLIEEHNWDCVINVLKHEMAHQAVSELFNNDAHGHGQLFSRACEMLGVPLPFRAASGDLSQPLTTIHDRASQDPRRTLLIKVDKILALARSSNEHEARLAMEKANHLITRYNLRADFPDSEQQYDFIIINHRKKRIEQHQRLICALLRDHFFVKVIYADLYEASSCTTHKTIELFGARENVVIADHVYHFLLSRLHEGWQSYRLAQNARVSQKRSYYAGLLAGFQQQLAVGSQPAAIQAGARKAESLSVMVCEQDQGLARFLRHRYPRLVTRRNRGTRCYRDAYEAGCQEGRKLVLSKAVTSHAANLGKKLPSAAAEKKS